MSVTRESINAALADACMQACETGTGTARVLGMGCLIKIEAIKAEILAKPCEACGKKMMLGELIGGRRSRNDRRFCSAACRMRIYQRRRARAKKLWDDQEKTLPMIAREVGSTVETVGKWLGLEGD